MKKRLTQRQRLDLQRSYYARAFDILETAREVGNVNKILNEIYKISPQTIINAALKLSKLYNVELVGGEYSIAIPIIKEIRISTGLGLKDSKEIFDQRPSLLNRDGNNCVNPIPIEEAFALKRKFEALGAKINIKENLLETK